MGPYIKRWFATPLGIALSAVIVAAIIIFAIGEILLALADPNAEQDSIQRPELIFAIALSGLLLAVFGFLATRPPGTTGPLEKAVVIGSTPFLAPAPPPPDVTLRSGPLGTVDDIEEGYMLYARNGALARALGKVPGSYEFGRRFSGYVYAAGVFGASDELWIPYEAILAVYPETRSAFLAIKGDETEAFGWDKPPASISRRPGPAEGPKGL